MEFQDFCNFTFILLLNISVHSLVAAYDCTNKTDGTYESSCQSMTRCVDGTELHVSCLPPQVVNEETGQCDNAINVKTPCGIFRDCSVRDDGGYPDLETKCQWYYTCSYGIFYGHSKCATGLVWNTVLQTCDFPLNVAPPCGRKQ